MATLPFRLYAVIFCVLISVVTIHTLMCYKCEGTVPGSKCENNMKEFAKKEKSKYSSNCSDFNFIKDPVCVIETREINGKIKVIVRGCSDGTYPFEKHFPFTNKTVTWNGLSVRFCTESWCNGISTAPALHSLSFCLSALTICTLTAAFFIA